MVSGFILSYLMKQAPLPIAKKKMFSILHNVKHAYQLYMCIIILAIGNMF